MASIDRIDAMEHAIKDALREDGFSAFTQYSVLAGAIDVCARRGSQEFWHRFSVTGANRMQPVADWLRDLKFNHPPAWELV